jgi:hypothetical protein
MLSTQEVRARLRHGGTGQRTSVKVKELLWSDSETEISWSRMHSVSCGLCGRQSAASTGVRRVRWTSLIAFGCEGGWTWAGHDAGLWNEFSGRQREVTE